MILGSLRIFVHRVILGIKEVLSMAKREQRELKLEVVNPEVLETDEARTIMAELIIRWGIDHGLFKKGSLDKDKKNKN